jgi:hypothetical protein
MIISINGNEVKYRRSLCNTKRRGLSMYSLERFAALPRNAADGQWEAVLFSSAVYVVCVSICADQFHMLAIGVIPCGTFFARHVVCYVQHAIRSRCQYLFWYNL